MKGIAQNFSDDFDEEMVLQLECGQVSEKAERQVSFPTSRSIPLFLTNIR
jgi:hypothetical protein